MAIILLLFPQSQKKSNYETAIGTSWKESDLYAPFDFAILKSPDEISREAAIARSKALLYYHQDSSAHIFALQNLQKSGLPRMQQARLHKTIDSIYRIGYLEIPEEIADLYSHTVVLLTGNIGSEHSPEEYVTPFDIESDLLADSILVPNIRYDAIRTKLEMDSRLSQGVYTLHSVKKNALIISKGELITPEKSQIIKSLNHELGIRFESGHTIWGFIFGQGLLCIMALLALYLFLRNTNSPILKDTRKASFLITLILMMAASVALIMNIREEWILGAPLCIAPILICVFFDMRVALYVHLATIIMLGNLVPNSFEFIFYQLVTGMLSIITVRNFDKRSNFFTVSAVIMLSYSLIYVCGIMSQEGHLGNIQWQRFAVFGMNAVLTLLAYPSIYLFEKLFGMTTPLTLQEIASTNTPALRELSRKAPGTFQHSMQVANISEDLINEIGGNALLARVGALYHDIGKSCNPLFYTENQNSGYNPHDELDYEESARVITSHVVDGIRLAKKYKLPNVVIDFIRTHHGTSKTLYFYNKFVNEFPNEEVDESAFTYPGPRPFSKETAIVMLVDGVEAACKSLKNPDKDSINELVDRIIDGKIEDNQLSNCDITFNDISKIRQKLKSKMNSIYHIRISYPVKNEQNK
ncbi:MAG: HDIG domain-containing protein [Bacteroidales bacterium]|nr:HDIG domain-containing protein [Bacteroidales bacterium]